MSAAPLAPVALDKAKSMAATIWSALRRSGLMSGQHDRSRSARRWQGQTLSGFVATGRSAAEHLVPHRRARRASSQLDALVDFPLLDGSERKRAPGGQAVRCPAIARMAAFMSSLMHADRQRVVGRVSGRGWSLLRANATPAEGAGQACGPKRKPHAARAEARISVATKRCLAGVA